MDSVRRWRCPASAVVAVVAGAVATEKVVECCEFSSTILRSFVHGRHYIHTSIQHISSNCYYKHYPNTLELVGRSLTID